MTFKLVFENSGDELVFDPVNVEVVEYYIEHLNKDNFNSFVAQNHFAKKIKDKIEDLHNSIVNANEFLEPLTGSNLETYNELEYLNQNNLNKIHANWVNSHSLEYNIRKYRTSKILKVRELADRLHHMYPDEINTIDLGAALDKLGFHDQYSKINLNLHDLEQSFNIRFSTQGWYSIANPFSKTILNNNLCNLRISFHHLGRTLYNKYINFDTNLDYSDENSYDQLLGFISIHLYKPQTIELSKEYKEWCKNRNVVPTGDFLNIGNLQNIDSRLTEYRQLIYKNLLNGNKIKFI